jgi:DNA polymerase-3 subunit beta
MDKPENSFAFTTEAAVLAKVMANVSGAIERRSTVPILANVMMAASDGRVTFTATNLEVTIAEGVPASDIRDGSVTVYAPAIARIAKSLSPNDVVRLEVAGDKLRVTSGDFSAELFVIDPADFPRPGRADMEFPHSFSIAGRRLKACLDHVSHAISTELTRYYLNGAVIEATAGGGDAELRVVATDGHRLALIKTPSIPGLSAFPETIIPRKAVHQLRKLLARYSGDVLVRMTDWQADAMAKHALSKEQRPNYVSMPALITFEFGQMLVAVKPIDGKFPDYRRVIPQSPQKVLTIQRETLRAGLGRVTAISSDRYMPVALNLTPEKVMLTVRHPDHGASETKLNGTTQYTGAALEIGFQGRYLSDALASFGDDLEIRFGDSAAPVTLRTAGDDSALEVVMPCRI